MTIKDLTGKQYGRLLVLEPTEGRQHRCILYKCRCDCGNTLLVRSDSLRSGNTQSCGCLQKERVGLAARKNLAGRRFGRLTVIRDTRIRKFGGLIWECRCICGNTVNVRADALVSGHTRSCGCLQRDTASSTLTKIMSGSNHWNWRGGRSPRNERDRNLTVYNTWRKAVFARDNYICYKCGKSKDIVAHHIESFADNLDMRFDIDNGITLCSKCHNLFHNLYGRGQNTREQFNMFTEDEVEFVV